MENFHIIHIVSTLLLVPWMSFLASAAGGNSGASWLVYHVGTRYGAWWGSFASRLPEIAFGITIGVFAGWYWGIWYVGVPAAIWAYVFMEIGHGNAFHMGRSQYDYPPRHQSLDYIILPLCKLLKIENRSLAYGWLFMGFKGLLLGAPLAPFGTALATAWPLSYWISFWHLKDPKTGLPSSFYAEYISGAFYGTVMVATAFINIL